MYLAWFDADRKKPTVQKIAEAHERYVAKFGRQPIVCLVNPEDAVEGAVVEIRPLKHIGRNCFWIGSDDADEALTPVLPATSVPAAVAPAAPAVRRSRKAVTTPEPAPTPVTPVALPKPRKTAVVAAKPQPAAEAPTHTPAPDKRRPRRERTAA